MRAMKNKVRASVTGERGFRKVPLLLESVTSSGKVSNPSAFKGESHHNRLANTYMFLSVFLILFLNFIKFKFLL